MSREKVRTAVAVQYAAAGWTTARAWLGPYDSDKHYCAGDHE